MDFYKKIIRSKKMRFKILSALRFIPDKMMLKMQYRIKLGRRLDLVNPKRYTEKVQLYKLNYRNPVMQQCADKYAVRKYVEDRGLSHILNTLYAVYDSPEKIQIDDLPKSFVLKLSNGSGTNLIVDDKQEIDIATIRKKFKDYQAQSSSYAGREWVYMTEKEPVIIAEQLLRDSSNPTGSLRDYKILCFNGEPHYIICVDGRYTDQYCHVVYDTNWVKQDVIIGESSAAANYDQPDTLDEMLEYARKLSDIFPAARVDFYSIDGKVYFGEITFFPWSGYMSFTPDEFDFELGKHFDIT